METIFVRWVLHTLHTMKYHEKRASDISHLRDQACGSTGLDNFVFLKIHIKWTGRALERRGLNANGDSQRTSASSLSAM